MAPVRPRGGAPLLPLFLVSAATLGFEVALTRYFAVAKWSEYGYWIISIVLAGFALSGVVMALARGWFERHGPTLLPWLPAALIVAAAVGFRATTENPFNPLQLQNAATLWPQLGNIALYYAVLLPYFFLAGLFISLCFVLAPHDTGRVYGFDLTGAAAGSALVLALMWLVHPFDLLPCLLLPLALAGVRAGRPRAGVAALMALAAGGALVLLHPQAAFNDFKAIYAPLHVPDSRTVLELRSPRGLYMLLDDFTERLDTDVSNDSGQLGLPGPPRTLGLYRDGNRLAALPGPEGLRADYAPATLAALPYALLQHPSVLLVGTSGGFRIAEARGLGATRVTALEPEPVLLGALRGAMPPVPPFPAASELSIAGTSPFAAFAGGARHDLIDIAADFLDSAEANGAAFSAEALAAGLHALTPQGILSVPVSIREFPAYALRMLATARSGLVRAGIADPAAHVLVYRSAWNVRMLLSPAPFEGERIAAALAFCKERSFDVSYYPGIDVAAARAGVYNDLPPVSFDTGEVASGEGPQDALADEAGATLRGEPTASAAAFNISPITLDRPAYYNILRLDHLNTLLRRLELLPQGEVAKVVNLAVLAQAVVIALAVLALPLLAGRRIAPPRGAVWRGAAYFAALGLGFLAIEIALIERASFYLNDRTLAFALVLTGMLLFSGLGSMAAGRFAARPGPAARAAALMAVLYCLGLRFGLEPLLLATLDWAEAARIGLILAVVAPVSLALGLPFPLGLEGAAAADRADGGFMPWAWGLNGAFSVVATPLANLLGLTVGFSGVLAVAAVLYTVASVTFPAARTFARG